MFSSKRALAFKLALTVALLLAACAHLKQCAYRGINRDDWQQPQKVIAALAIRPGDQVADLGAGGGYFTFYLAQAAGDSGKVFAVDIDRDMIALIEKEAVEQGVKNVATILATADNPRLPESGVDLIFTSNTYHHLQDRLAYFANLRRHLRPGGRVAIIDYDRRAWFEGLLRHYTPSEFIKREMAQAGYALQQELDFLDRQSFLIFTAR